MENNKKARAYILRDFNYRMDLGGTITTDCPKDILIEYVGLSHQYGCDEVSEGLVDGKTCDFEYCYGDDEYLIRILEFAGYECDITWFNVDDVIEW